VAIIETSQLVGDGGSAHEKLLQQMCDEIERRLFRLFLITAVQEGDTNIV
jgi:hypothetical protein